MASLRLLCWLALGIQIIICHIDQSQCTNLYENDRAVITYTTETFKPNVLYQNHFTINVFYVHWCGHCIKFSSVVRQFSQEIQGWNSVVHVGVVNCEDDKSICAELEIQLLPQVILIPPKSESLSNLKSVPIRSVRDFYDLIIPELVHDPVISSRTNLPSILVAHENQLCLMLSNVNQTKNQFVIFEENSSKNSAKVILDLLNYRDFVEIRRFYGEPRVFDNIVTHHVNLPAILRVQFNPCGFIPIMDSFTNWTVLRQQFSNMIKSEFQNGVSDLTNLEKEFQTPIVEVKEVKKYNLSYVDLHNTLRYSLMDEIANYKTLNQTQLNVIKEYYRVIHKYFPFDNENVKRLFKRMNMWLLARKNSTISVISYMEAIKISDGFLKPTQSWRHCNGSKPYLRGYPCGLWVLFHTMTVNEYNMTKNNPEPKNDVLKAFRNYITTFFSCKNCRDHFSQISQNMESQLTHVNSSVLWLWQVHNQVNYRLNGDQSEDPFFPKIQFPSKAMCSDCFVDDHQYNTTNVFKFLTFYYSKDSIESDAFVAKPFLLTVILAFIMAFYF